MLSLLAHASFGKDGKMAVCSWLQASPVTKSTRNWREEVRDRSKGKEILKNYCMCKARMLLDHSTE